MGRRDPRPGMWRSCSQAARYHPALPHRSQIPTPPRVRHQSCAAGTPRASPQMPPNEHPSEMHTPECHPSATEAERPQKTFRRQGAATTAAPGSPVILGPPFPKDRASVWTLCPPPSLPAPNPAHVPPTHSTPPVPTRDPSPPMRHNYRHFDGIPM